MDRRNDKALLEETVAGSHPRTPRMRSIVHLAPFAPFVARALLVASVPASVLGLAALASATSGCSEPSGEVAPRPAPRASASTPPGKPQVSDGGVAEDSLDAGTWNGPFAYALFPATPIMSDMEWPIRPDQLKPGERQRAIRIGYFRQGTKLAVFPEAHKKPNCLDGWYELVQGGFVCAKFATLDPNHPKVKNAPHPPDLSGPLPYEYGINLRNGTPMYKKLPSFAQRMRFEPWLNPHRPPPRPRTDDTGDTIVPAFAPTPVGADPSAAGETTPESPGTSAISTAGSPISPWRTSRRVTRPGCSSAG